MRAYVLTCAERADVCAETVADLGQTDWGAPPTVVVDQSTAADKRAHIVETAFRLFTRVVEDSDSNDDVVLVCEDDVIFNRSLRHNLERWAPIVDRRSDGHLVGSLYNPDVVDRPADGRSAVVSDPRRFYGSQGVVLSVATAQALIEWWDDQPSAYDIRISRLAARWSPLWYHAPSLVQHRAVGSTWGGRAHSAVDFSVGWRAR